MCPMPGIPTCIAAENMIIFIKYVLTVIRLRIFSIEKDVQIDNEKIESRRI